ncbi:hypothetical protein ACSBR1_037352 [Camellia fascicularis]
MGTQERQPRHCWSGIGNWKLILNSCRDIFEERTEVDLKDKWRNMIRLQLYDLVEHKVQGDGNFQIDQLSEEGSRSSGIETGTRTGAGTGSGTETTIGRVRARGGEGIG